MPPSEGAHPRPKPAKAADRLRRLLVVVPYLVRNPGTEVAEAARMFGLTEQELLADLDLLFVTGLPPYGPGDLVDVDVQDGRIWISMADHFSRPLRLTRPEALNLYLRGAALAATPGLREATALASALGKLREGLGTETLGEVPEHVEAAPSGHPAETLDRVRAAAEGRVRLRIEYYAASSAETTTRDIDPEEVFFAIGNWYVAAWDHRSNEERLFRADRIRRAEPTGERFQARGLAGAGRPLYSPTERDVPVRLLLRPEARWVAEYYETASETELEDGSLEVVLPASRLEWVARLVLRLSGSAAVLAPPEAKDLVRDLARRTREPYG